MTTQTDQTEPDEINPEARAAVADYFDMETRVERVGPYLGMARAMQMIEFWPLFPTPFG